MKSEPAEKPVGRTAVRRSILRAARRSFARHGSRAPLRSIAEAAGVNVGLIHRHFGRKDDLVREVIEHTLATSTRAVADRGTDPPATIRAMFLSAARNTDFVRMIAWLSLESGPDGPSPLDSASERTITGVRGPARAASGAEREGGHGADHGTDHDARLMLALTAIYGWSVFSREMLSAFDAGEERRAEFEGRIADLLAELTADTPQEAPQ